MSWRDQWQKASFRDVEFRFRSASASLGRRNVVHSYPGRDDPYVEDIGRKAREFTIEAFVLGDNYIDWRDRLEAACEQAGPGDLVHPTRGRMRVALQDCRPSENIDAGGLVSYSLTFIEAGSNRFPAVRADTPALVSGAADSALSAVQGDFAKTFKVAGYPAFVGSAALANVTAAINTIRGTVLSFVPDMNILPAFTFELAAMLGAAESLIGLPADLASRFGTQIAALNGVLSQDDARRATASLVDFGATLPAVPATTPSRVRQGTNQEALVNLTRRTALVESARAASQVAFTSRTEALAVRDQLADALQAQAETAPDSVYIALTDLRVALVKDIGTRAGDLTDLVEVTPRATLPAIVVAYQLYGDPSRDAEIVSRNRIRHPGFIPGGCALEVLAV